MRSPRPLENANAWICIRTNEAFRSPDPRRTIVQVHDLYRRRFARFNEFAAVLFTHPSQQELWNQNGFSGHSILQPIGARDEIGVRDALPMEPTIGVFSREICRKGVYLKHSDLVVEAAPKINGRFHVCSPNIVIPGFPRHRRASIPTDYEKIDLLLSLTRSSAVPLAAYEGCAAGVPVIVFTNTQLIGNDWPGVIKVDPQKLAPAANQVIEQRSIWFDRRHNIARSPYRLSDWVRLNLTLAENVDR